VVVSAGAWLRVDMHQRGGKPRQRAQKAVLGSDRCLCLVRHLLILRDARAVS
jgi:hypothetical protein